MEIFNNLDFNWLLLGITLILTAFITFVRVQDYRNHQKMVAEFIDKEKDVQVILEDKQAMYIYLAMAAIIFVVAFIAGTSLLERVTMAIVFTVLILTELLNALMNAKLYASSRAFLYGVETQKYRSIKKYEAKGKRNTKLLLLNKTEMVLPNAYAEALKAHIKSIKDAKK